MCAYRVLDAVEHAFTDIRTVHVGFGNIVHSFAHGIVIMPGGDDQIGFADLTIGIDPIMVDQCSTRRFDNTDTLFAWLLMGVANIGAENIWILQQHARSFRSEQGFDQAGVVIV